MIIEYFKIVKKLADYYRTSLTQNQIEMYAEDLSELKPDELLKVINIYRKNPNNAFFPLPGQLIALAKPVTNDLDEGRDVASRVIAAVAKFGSYNPSDAKKYIGEVGWECVQRFGGWNTLCSDLTSENQNIMNAQLRDIATTLIKKNKNGTLSDPINFSKAISSEETKKIGSISFDVLKKLTN